jgi:hypothetical protein
VAAPNTEKIGGKKQLYPELIFISKKEYASITINEIF